MPDFPEGQQALMEFLAKKIQYPNTGTEGNGVQGDRKSTRLNSSHAT